MLAALKLNYEKSFEGGGWALVRRVKEGNTWHPANDSLHGTSVYGNYGTSVSDSTFSVDFAAFGITSDTVFLFATGALRVNAFFQFRNQPASLIRRLQCLVDCGLLVDRG